MIKIGYGNDGTGDKNDEADIEDDFNDNFNSDDDYNDSTVYVDREFIKLTAINPPEPEMALVKNMVRSLAPIEGPSVFLQRVMRISFLIHLSR